MGPQPCALHRAGGGAGGRGVKSHEEIAALYSN